MWDYHKSFPLIYYKDLLFFEESYNLPDGRDQMRTKVNERLSKLSTKQRMKGFDFTSLPGYGHLWMLFKKSIIDEDMLPGFTYADVLREYYRFLVVKIDKLDIDGSQCAGSDAIEQVWEYFN